MQGTTNEVREGKWSDRMNLYCNQFVELLCFAALCCLKEILVLHKNLLNFIRIFTFLSTIVSPQLISRPMCILEATIFAIWFYLFKQLCFRNEHLDLKIFPQLVQGRETPSR